MQQWCQKTQRLNPLKCKSKLSNPVFIIFLITGVVCSEMEMLKYKHLRDVLKYCIWVNVCCNIPSLQKAQYTNWTEVRCKLGSNGSINHVCAGVALSLSLSSELIRLRFCDYLPSEIVPLWCWCNLCSYTQTFSAVTRLLLSFRIQRF